MVCVCIKQAGLPAAVGGGNERVHRRLAICLQRGSVPLVRGGPLRVAVAGDVRGQRVPAVAREPIGELLQAEPLARWQAQKEAGEGRQGGASGQCGAGGRPRARVPETRSRRVGCPTGCWAHTRGCVSQQLFRQCVRSVANRGLPLYQSSAEAEASLTGTCTDNLLEINPGRFQIGHPTYTALHAFCFEGNSMALILSLPLAAPCFGRTWSALIKLAAEIFSVRQLEA